MSRSAHAQGGITPRELPKCSRCKKEFVLVFAQYENGERGAYEWECTKCNKVVPRHFLKEDEPSKAEKFFSQKAKKLQEEEERQRKASLREIMRSNIRGKPIQ